MYDIYTVNLKLKILAWIYDMNHIIIIIINKSQ